MDRIKKKEMGIFFFSVFAGERLNSGKRTCCLNLYCPVLPFVRIYSCCNKLNACLKQKFRAPLTNLHCLLYLQAITSMYTRIDAELWIQKIHHSDMISGASLHQITWYTFSEAQKPNILSDFSLMGKASTHKNERYLLYECTYVNT